MGRRIEPGRRAPSLTGAPVKYFAAAALFSTFLNILISQAIYHQPRTRLSGVHIFRYLLAFFPVWPPGAFDPLCN
jgi:hypothetical protein